MFDTNTKSGDYFNLIVTHDCNKKCVFCIDKKRGSKEYITLDSVKTILKKEGLKARKDVLVIGGELEIQIRYKRTYFFKKEERFDF